MNQSVQPLNHPHASSEPITLAASRHSSAAGRLHAAHRRGFNLIELLLALAISVALLAATLVALNASYIAYQRTTRAASTHTISRLAMDRMLALVRTGRDFGPLPANPNESIVTSDLIEIITANEQGVVIEWVEAEEALYIKLFDPETGSIFASHLLLEGVPAQYDSANQRIKPFTLEFERGRHLYRATIDLTIVPDDNMSVAIEGTDAPVIRLVATAMPRVNALSSY